VKQKAWKTYVFWIVLTEAVGALAGLLTREGTEIYRAMIQKPPLSPPAAVFPVVWVILYALMGISAARVYRLPPSAARSRGLLLYLAQLFFNFFWSVLFFNARAFGAAALWLAALWALILWMILTFRRADLTAARLQVPYLLWVTFAGYLNVGVWMLNR
jgi:tryptophan-rich sensory protein